MPRRTEKAAGDTGLVLPDSRAVGNALPPALPSGQRGHCPCTAIGSAGLLSPRPPSQVPAGESESKQSCVSSSPGTGGRTAWGRLPVGQSTHFGFPPIKPVIRSTEKAPTWATQGASRGLPSQRGGTRAPRTKHRPGHGLVTISGGVWALASYLVSLWTCPCQVGGGSRRPQLRPPDLAPGSTAGTSLQLPSSSEAKRQRLFSSWACSLGRVAGLWS